MTRKLILALAATAALAAPMAAQAENSAVTINGAVQKACVIGTPDSITLVLGDMTGADGRISAAMASSAVSASTTIANAWCNAPSILTVDAEPLKLSQTPGYDTPPGFARLVTYNAALQGWSGPVHDRPIVGSAGTPVSAANAYASAGLTLQITTLEALDAAGTVGAGSGPTAPVLEAGAYSGVVVISVATQ